MTTSRTYQQVVTVNRTARSAYLKEKLIAWRIRRTNTVKLIMMNLIFDSDLNSGCGTNKAMAYPVI
jgi:hypothetical protein